MTVGIAAQNWGLIGHDWAVALLRRSLLNGRQRHAYLFTGGRSLGKRRLALAFAKALNCEAEDIAGRPCENCRSCRAINRESDPDLIVAKGEAGAPLKVEAIRDVARLLALKPFAARYRIAIFEDFDLVVPLAQDALLKTLEEPPARAILMLLANAEGKVLRGRLEDVILPTIRSRAQTIPLRPAPLEAIKGTLIERGCDEGRADLVARLSGGRVGWALNASRDDQLLARRQETLDSLRAIVDGGRLARIKSAEQLSKSVAGDKGAMRNILEVWLTYWRDVLLQSHDCPVKPFNSDRADEIRSLALRIDAESVRAALQATRRTMDALATNANLRLALDALFLDYPGLE